MTARPTNILPEFKRPPVVEVAASLQFDRLVGLNAPRLGLLWGEYKADFPRTEQHAPLADVKEDFGPPRVSAVEIELTELLETPRFWFVNESGTKLLQVQSSRFALNWRRLETEEAYPRYSAIRALFVAKYDIFQAFLAREGVGPVVPNQIELTYVNHLPAQAPDSSRIPAERYIRLWAGGSPDSALHSPDDLRFQARYLLGIPQSPSGRLYVKLESRIRVLDGSPIYALHLVGRGAPMGKGLDGALAFFDFAHEALARTFADVTTPSMHLEWKRIT